MRQIPSFLCLCFLVFSFDAMSQRVDTVGVLKTNRSKPAIYKAPNGKVYKVRFVADPTEPFTTESAKCGEDIYSGKDRAVAKTSLAGATPVKQFVSITALIAFLTPDATMETKVTTTSKRVAEESFNVRLAKNIFIYAMKKESDNDYHVIIGDNIKKSKATFFNIEISGVPKTGNATNKQALQTIRDFFENNFVQLCGSKYAIFDSNPVPVSVQGSVFFDIDHKAGAVGPTGFRPKTAWEIHPVSAIKFL